MCILQLTSYVHSSQFAQMFQALYIIVNSAHMPCITALSASTNCEGDVILSDKHSTREHVESELVHGTIDMEEVIWLLNNYE